MDFQTRKLNLIAYLAQIQDESILCKIESFLLKRNIKDNETTHKPFTLDEFIDRIEKSEMDFKEGKFKSQEELEKISEKW
ncbi:MAG: hypothetical protein ACTIJ9_11630 [Aequorivita sp.]